MSKDLISNLNELQAALKGYFQTRLDLVKLTLIEKSSRIISIIISSLVVILISVFIVVFGAVIFVVWYYQTYHNLIEGLFIGLLMLIVVLVVFLLLRNKIVTSVMLRHFSEIINELEEDEKI